MKKYTPEIDFEKEEITGDALLEMMARKGAREMLAYALEEEIRQHLDKSTNLRDKKGRRLVVRNGYHPEREIITGIGPITIRQPRVDDRGLEGEERFSCPILPRYLRRAPSIDNLIPVLYLKGISTNEFQTALSSILGEGVKGNRHPPGQTGGRGEYIAYYRSEMLSATFSVYFKDNIMGAPALNSFHEMIRERYTGSIDFCVLRLEDNLKKLENPERHVDVPLASLAPGNARNVKCHSAR